jgi:hypothetical protein
MLFSVITGVNHPHQPVQFPPFHIFHMPHSHTQHPHQLHKGPHHRERYSSFAVSLFNFVFFNFALKLGNIQDSRIRNAVYKALRFLLRTSLTTVPLCKMPFIDRSRNGAEAS